jgi:glycosyltransferase involved in cell wall biosynthesis
MTLAPIVLFTYNRPNHTRLTIEALLRNSEAKDSSLHVFSDGPKHEKAAANVLRVREYLSGVSGFKSIRVTERDHNLGLAASVISGVSEILEQHDCCIVLEDDMVCAPNFLAFMNQALTIYRDRHDVFSVTGYNYPLPIRKNHPESAYLSYRGSSWGWGTWRDRWRKVDWQVGDYAQFSNDPREQEAFSRAGEDMPNMLKMQMAGKLDSWAIRFDYAHHKNNAFCLHAVRSKIQNIGFDGSGVHCDVSDDYKVELDDGDKTFALSPHIELNDEILQLFNARFRPRYVAGLSAATKKVEKSSGRKAVAENFRRYFGLID